MNREEDAFGRALYDAWRDRGRGYHIIEREDGLVDAMENRMYLRPPGAWEPFERQAMRYVRGRVLDIGCGAGRHAIHLQGRGLDVLGTDISPLAVRVSRARGLRQAKVVSAARIPASWGPFDTILMLGNNFGLLENRERGRGMLRRLYRMTTARGRILAGERDPYLAAPAEHRRYHRWNRRRGRMGGQIRLREIARGTGWWVARFLPPRGALYIAVLEKSG